MTRLVTFNDFVVEYRTYTTEALERYLEMLQDNTAATGGHRVDRREQVMSQVLKERVGEKV